MGYFAEKDLEINPLVDHCQMCNIYSESLHETIMEHKETKKNQNGGSVESVKNY
jgi:hypothetical protein